MARRTEDHEVEDAIRNGAMRISHDLARTARDARKAAEDLGDALRHSAEDAAEEAQVRAGAAVRGVRRGVREHPLAWLGAAAGIGALAALVITARSR